MRNISGLFIGIFAALLFHGCYKEPRDLFVRGNINRTLNIGDTVNFDLDKDHIDDYVFHLHWNYEDEKKGVLYDPSEIYAEGYVKSVMAVDYPQSNIDTTRRIIPFTQGDLVDGDWENPVGRLVFKYLDLGWKERGQKYMGIALNINNKLCYGWIKLEVGEKGKTMTLYDYAYRTDGKFIRAGQTSK